MYNLRIGYLILENNVLSSINIVKESAQGVLEMLEKFENLGSGIHITNYVLVYPNEMESGSDHEINSGAYLHTELEELIDIELIGA